MTTHLPIKNLVRLNWLLVLVVSAIVFLFLFQDKTETHKVLYTVMTAIAIGTIGFANIGIIIILARRFGTGTKKFRRYRLLLTYPAGAATYLCMWPVFAHFSHRVWSYSDMGLLFMFLVSSAVVNTMIVILHDFLILQNDKTHAELELSKLKTAHAEAANLLLQQQIQPHFLFNALNTLKALYRKNPGAGDNYIVHLANFLRASVFNHSKKLSKLEDELSLLQDYVAMQQIRFGTALVCHIEIPEAFVKDFYLPTFSLQPLVENAIKHNELTEAAPLKVSVYVNDDRIIVSNNLQKRQVKVPSTNHGLANLSERYRIWSGDKVIIREDHHLFSVSIKLLKDEYSDHRG